MFVILFGPPAAGKGTQAAALLESLKIPHISTGDIFRRNLKEGTDLGKQAKSFMDRGALVPDELVAEIVTVRLTDTDCAKGALLDGFPRSIPQARFLDRALELRGQKVHLVVNLQIPDEEVVRRMSGRRACMSCGATYHVSTKPTQVDGICDRCGKEVIQRADDKEETVKMRLVAYHEQTSPILGHYRETGVVRDINGIGAIQEITRKALELTENLRGQ